MRSSLALTNVGQSQARCITYPHYQFKESLICVSDKDFVKMRIPNVVAKFSLTPGEMRTLGPSKGEHTIEILKEQVRLSDEKIDLLRELGVI